MSVDKNIFSYYLQLELNYNLKYKIRIIYYKILTFN